MFTVCRMSLIQMSMNIREPVVFILLAVGFSSVVDVFVNPISG